MRLFLQEIICILGLGWEVLYILQFLNSHDATLLKFKTKLTLLSYGSFIFASNQLNFCRLIILENLFYTSLEEKPNYVTYNYNDK